MEVTDQQYQDLITENEIEEEEDTPPSQGKDSCQEPSTEDIKPSN